MQYITPHSGIGRVSHVMGQLNNEHAAQMAGRVPGVRMTCELCSQNRPECFLSLPCYVMEFESGREPTLTMVYICFNKQGMHHLRTVYKCLVTNSNIGLIAHEYHSQHKCTICVCCNDQK